MRITKVVEPNLGHGLGGRKRVTQDMQVRSRDQCVLRTKVTCKGEARPRSTRVRELRFKT